MKTLFTDELIMKLRQREKEIAEGKGIRVTRLGNLSDELKPKLRNSRTRTRKQQRNAADSSNTEAAA